jgi:pimeloyl-ACP methyl ester carboxylesterase
VQDLETVVDAAGVERFDLLGISQGCAVSIAYAVRHPERVRSLILYGGYSQGWAARNDPEELARREAMVTLTGVGWGQGNPAFRQMFTTLYFPDATDEEAQWFNELQRISASPEGAQRLQRALSVIDVRPLLRKVKVPTLILHSREDSVVPFEAGRILARFIEGARFVPLDSRNHLILAHEPAWPKLVGHIREFLANPEG